MTRTDILAALGAAYLLSDDERSALIAQIKQAELDSKSAMYQQALGEIDATSLWKLTQSDQDTAESQAESDVESIMATFLSDLKSAAQTFLDTWEDTWGTLVGAARELSKTLSTWIKQRFTWKSQQVAGVSTGRGMDDGTELFVDDVTGDEVDFPDYIDTSLLQVAVLPVESSSDFCKEYAGQLFDLDEIDDIPEFPAHTGCIHYKIIVYDAAA